MSCRAGLKSLQETRFTLWRDHAKPSSDEDRQPREKAHHGSAFIIDTGNTRKKSLLGLFRGLSALPLHMASFVAVFLTTQLGLQTRLCRVSD